MRSEWGGGCCKKESEWVTEWVRQRERRKNNGANEENWKRFVLLSVIGGRVLSNLWRELCYLIKTHILCECALTHTHCSVYYHGYTHRSMFVFLSEVCMHIGVPAHLHIFMEGSNWLVEDRAQHHREPAGVIEGWAACLWEPASLFLYSQGGWRYR